MNDPIVWVADVGSIQQRRFGWCRAAHGQPVHTGGDVRLFVSGIASDLTAGVRVALGFECPLFVPITEDPAGLTRARRGEASRPWSAGAGASALATGLTECVWVFEQLLLLTHGVVRPTLDWNVFQATAANLFIWEAFVSGKAKGAAHHDDAAIAATSFWNAYPAIDRASAVEAERPYSLVGAALLRAGLSQDLTLLSQPCIVIKA